MQDTLEKTRIEIWPFMCLFGGYTGNLGPIDFLFGLPINRIINAGQNKFEVDILKNVAKIANLRPKIASVLNHSTLEFRDFSKRAPGN